MKEIWKDIPGCEAHRKTGVCRSSICSACRGEYQQAGGYKWKYNNTTDNAGV